jgi:hypothetical protein
MRMRPAIFFFLILAYTVSAAEQTQSPILRQYPNRDSIVAVIHSVTVLRFETKKPISEMRLFLNGKLINNQPVRTSEKGLYLAIVPKNNKLDIHAKVGDSNQLLSAALPSLLRSNIFEIESFGPGKDLNLDAWTEVFGITRTDFQGKDHGGIKLERFLKCPGQVPH